MAKKSPKPPGKRTPNDGALPPDDIDPDCGAGGSVIGEGDRPNGLVFRLADVDDEMRPKIIPSSSVGLVAQGKTLLVTMEKKEIGRVPASYYPAVSRTMSAGDYQAFVDRVADEDVWIRIISDRMV